MMTVLLTTTDDAAELEREYKRWTAAFKRKPDVIVAHQNMPFGLSDHEHATWNGTKTQVRFRGVRVLALDRFFDMHASDLLEPRDDEDEVAQERASIVAEIAERIAEMRSEGDSPRKFAALENLAEWIKARP
jgi:hypothetical protein